MVFAGSYALITKEEGQGKSKVLSSGFSLFDSEAEQKAL